MFERMLNRGITRCALKGEIPPESAGTILKTVNPMLSRKYYRHKTIRKFILYRIQN
jgi:hypothetical protein